MTKKFSRKQKNICRVWHRKYRHGADKAVRQEDGFQLNVVPCLSLAFACSIQLQYWMKSSMLSGNSNLVKRVFFYGRFFTISGPSHRVSINGRRFHIFMMRAYFGFEGFSDGISTVFPNQ